MNSFLAYHPTYSTADLLSEYYYYFTKETGDAQRGGRGWQIVLVMKTMQLKQLKGEKIYIVSWFQKDLTQSIMVGKARLWEHVSKRYFHHPAAGGSITCKGLPGYLLPPAKSHSGKASQPQHITTDWGPKLGRY